MFGGVPTFSKAGFMQQFVQQGYNAWTTHPDNDPLKKYNEEVRKLTLEGMRTNIKLSKAQIDELYRNKGTSFVPGTKTGITTLGVSKAMAMTDEGVPIPNDPTIPSGYTVPKEVMEQFPMHIGAITVSPAPMSPAAVIEEQYGDAMSWLYGPMKLGADIYHSGMVWAFNNGAQGFNNPKRGQMIKKSLVKPRLSFGLRPPNFKGPNTRSKFITNKTDMRAYAP
jgi:hypothetical protein